MVLELPHVPFVFGLLVELLLGPSVPYEEDNLQALENLELVRAEHFQQSLDLPRHRQQKNGLL